MAFKKLWAVEADDHALALAWDGDNLLVTPSTGSMLLLDAGGGITAKLPGHGLGNGAASVANAGVVTCGFDGHVRYYDHAGASIRDITLGKDWIERVRWSPDGRHLGAALGKTLFILNKEGETIRTMTQQSTVSDFAWNPKDPLKITTVGGGGARMWKLGESEAYARFDWGGASLLVDWSPDGRWLVTGDQTPSVHLYDFTRDYPLHIQGYEAKVKTMAFSPNGKKLATGGGSMVTVWDCTGKTGPENTTPAQLNFHKGDVETLAWSPDGETLATGDITGRLVFSDAKGKPFAAFADEESLTVLAWHPDGQRLAAGDAAGRVVVFGR